MKKTNNERGAVSIFIVVFSALLIVTISTVFIRLMLQDQLQATNNDLSRSALDSANAGVEDAKRLLVKYNNECVNASGADCATWLGYMNGNDCKVLKKIPGISSAAGAEVQVGDTALEQAYTCVTVQLNTDDYVGTLSPGVSRLVHLKGVTDFTDVMIEWYSNTNLQASGKSAVTLNPDPTKLELKTSDKWQKDATTGQPIANPSLMRAQLLQVGDQFQLTDLDSADRANNDTGTLFMIPIAATGPGGVPVNLSQTFQSGYDNPLQGVQCYTGFPSASSNGYACGLKIPLLKPSSPTNPALDRKDAYLRLNAPYNDATDFRVTLWNGSTLVKFSGVQPRVDSTGRAGDLFRRVSSRIEPGGNAFPYVEGALDITGDLCKTFAVTNDPAGFNPGACTP